MEYSYQMTNNSHRNIHINFNFVKHLFCRKNNPEHFLNMTGRDLGMVGMIIYSRQSILKDMLINIGHPTKDMLHHKFYKFVS